MNLQPPPNDSKIISTIPGMVGKINLGMDIADNGGLAHRVTALEAWTRGYTVTGTNEWRCGTVDMATALACVAEVFGVAPTVLRNFVALSPHSADGYVISIPDRLVATLFCSNTRGQAFSFSLQAHAHTKADIQALHQALVQAFPAPTPERLEPRVNINFWMQSEQGGGSNYIRTLDVLDWAPTRGNYTENVRAGLDEMMAFRPTTAGQLFLWHGPPGTGKTYALRALAWQWRHWCDVHYISDPFTLLGGGPRYMNDVLMSDTDEYLVSPWLEAEPEDVRAATLSGDDRWRLLVLEDSGELLSVTARQESGPALGRLLNMVDGLLGQGLKFLVLITTNEPLEKLHPAVARPGRCAGQIEFAALTKDEARAFLTARGVTAIPTRPPTLAELYQLSAKQIAVTQTKGGSLGFK